MPTQPFTIYTGKSYAGEIVDSGPRVTQTGILTSLTLDFGLALNRDSATVDRGVATGGAANVFAIAMREYNHEASTRPSDGTTVYKQTESVSIMQQGFIYVELTGATGILAGEVMHVVTATGEFTKDAVAAGIVACLNVVAEEAAVAGEIVKVRIDRIV